MTLKSLRRPRMVRRFLKIHLHSQVTSEQEADHKKNPSARLKWPHTGVDDVREPPGIVQACCARWAALAGQTNGNKHASKTLKRMVAEFSAGHGKKLPD